MAQDWMTPQSPDEGLTVNDLVAEIKSEQRSAEDLARKIIADNKDKLKSSTTVYVTIKGRQQEAIVAKIQAMGFEIKELMNQRGEGTDEFYIKIPDSKLP